MSALLTFIIVTQMIVVITLVYGLYKKNTNVICKSKKRLDGKTAVVTGGTNEMGLEIATDFAARGARVIIACPFKEEGTKAEINIIESTGNEGVKFKSLDLASFDSVRKFAGDILKTEDRLDILVNNAGVGVSHGLSSDGLHITMQVNYFGLFLLSLLLLPVLKKTGRLNEPSRIVNVLHRIGRVDLQNSNRTDFWASLQRYANSKLCVVMFTRELAKRLKNTHVVVNSVHPGTVGTRIFHQIHWLPGNLITLISCYLSKNPWEGAQTSIHVAVDPEAGEKSGEYFVDCRLYETARSTYDSKTSERLWEESVSLVKLSDGEMEKCFKS